MATPRPPAAASSNGFRHLEEHRSHLAVALDLLVDAHLAAGDVDGGATADRRLAEVASSVDNERFAAMAAGVEGRVAMARGDLDAAATHLEAALIGWSRLELPFELARTRFDLARALANDRPDEAIDHARRALAVFEALGAGLDADRVAALLRSLGVTGRIGAKRVGVLTDREQEVLRLLGAGLSNPEIAGPPARQPQDGVPPREQHPDQARPAQPGRGGRLRRRRARPDCRTA